MDVSSLYQSKDSSSKSDSALNSISKDFDMFLSLLTTQLQNQDPLDPMDNQEMMNQLVNFASVEQQIQQNKNLESLISLLNASSDAAAVSYLGKQIQVEGNETEFAGQSITFGYQPESGAQSVTIAIVNADGDVVRTVDGETSAQRHEFVWDGTDDDGATVPDGAYTFVVAAADDDGDLISVDTDITGVVTGSAPGEDGPMVRIGAFEYPLTAVMSVSNPA